MGEGAQLGVMLDVGSHAITLVVSNDNQDTAIDEFSIKVIDNHGPKLGK